MTAGSSGALAGLTVVVTGGNRGIGFGLASGVAKAGASVVVWGRSAAANDTAVAALSPLCVAAGAGGRATSVVCDVASSSAVAAAMATSVEVTGRVDAVFANAAVASPYKPFHEQSTVDWRETWAVNLHGMVHTFRAALEHMLSREGGGALVGVGSMASAVGQRYYSPYAASKAGVVALVRSVAVEYARAGIRANAFLPGWVETDMTAGASDKLREQVTRRAPAGRFGVPGDFESAAVFLADPRYGFHTGDTLLIDGGYLSV